MQHAESPLPPADAHPHALSPNATATDDHHEATTTTRGEHDRDAPLAPEGQQQGASQGAQDGARASTQGSAAQQGDEGAQGPQGDAPAGEGRQRALGQEGSAAGQQELSSSVGEAQPGAAPAQGGDGAGSALASAGDDEPSAIRASAAPQDSSSTAAGDNKGVALEQPKPSNPARETSSLLAPPPPPSLSVTDDAAPAADAPAPTPPPPSSSSPAPSSAAAAAAAAAARTASPALSASPGPGATSSSSERPPPAKKFQSSLAVNKKFLEKAGEKAKPEVKPVISRVATSPAPPPVSSTHPRLLAGKLSSGPSLSLGTGASSTSSSPGTSTTGWGAKKPATPTPGSSSSATGAQGSSAAGAAGGAQGAKGGPVWGSAAAAGGASSSGPAPLGQQQEQRAPPREPQTQAYVPGDMRGGPNGARGGLGGSSGWGGARNMEMDFPTAAEAANAKDARQKAVADQVQARERASQARAAAAAAHNAHLLEELDAFRGVHLNPNAAHWDEADDDDFLDTTIEFADGTQYKLDAAPPTPAADELREPGPRELALRERPLAPGEVVEQPRREERFGDDYDRSWPRRPSRSAGENRNLFNDRLGKLEPAASGAADAGHPPPRRAGAEPTSILRSGASAGSGGHSDLPPHLALGGHVPPPTSGRRPSITSPRMNTHAPLHPVGRRESAHEPAARTPAWGGAGQRRPSSTAHAGPALGAAAAAGAQDRQLPPHLAARAAAAQAPMSPPRGARRPSVPAASAILPTSPARPSASKQAQPLAAPVADTPSSAEPEPAPTASAAAAPSAASEAAAPPQPSIEELHAREMHAAAERARKRREEEEQKRLEQTERARKKAQELEEKMRATDEAKAKEKKEKEEAARPAPREREKERRPSVAGAQPAPPVAPADKATSWRAAAKPLPSQAAAASAAAVGKASEGASSRRQAREQPSAPVAAPPSAVAPEPTSILPRPSAPASQQQPAAQPSAWRRPSAPAAPPPAGSARAPPVRQLPPHLAAQAAQAEAKAAAAAAAAPPPPAPVEAAPPPAADLAKPSTPPPQPPVALISPPTSPSQDRKRQDPSAAAKHGYKLPAVSQFDDLMSRIKGVMGQPSDGAPVDDAAASPNDEGAPAVAPAAKADGSAAEPAHAPLVEVPTVKLPPRTRAGKAAARAAAAAAHVVAQAHQPVVSLPAPTEPRGRGRGRADAPRPARQAAPVPAFESREPVLPYHSSRIPRSQSPPPAWRQYTIRLAAQPPRRPVAARVLKNFTNPSFPKPLYPFSWEPVLKDVNPRRLNRDDMLMPKKYDKHGLPIYAVALPKRRFSVRASAVEPEIEPEIVVSISNVALVRQVALEPEPATPPTTSFEPAQPALKGQVVDSGFAPFSGKPRGDGRAAADAGAAWRREGGEGAGDAAPFTLGGTNGQEAKFTGALNGEKIEATPRKVTTAPGRDANGLSKPPTSPPYKPQDLSQVTSSPSAAAPWASKKLTYSALDPTASSVWSAAPEEGSVHARHIAASNLPENSLQGIVDEDPSEALPSSLAELKSEDGHSNADHKELGKQVVATKDDAKLRAAAPSFSSFLHESAAAVDPSMSPSAAPPRHSQQQQQQQQQHSVPGFPGQVAPQPSPSPIAGYSASHPFSPHLYAPQRPMSQQPQQHALYLGYPGQAPSPFATQPIHQAYSTSPFAAASPIPPTHGYPSPYRESASPALPHGITNPALIASYSSYGLQPQMAAPGGPGRGYGAVGAIGGPPGPGPIGRPPHQHQQQQQQQGAPGVGMYGRPQASVGYHLGGGGAPGQYGHSFQHAHQQLQQSQQHGGSHSGAPYRMDSYGSNDGRSLSTQHGGGGPSAYGPPAPPSAGTTMASPVIMPQQLPPVPHFSPGHPGHHVPLGSPVASAQGMGLGAGGMSSAYGHGYGQGGYGYPQQQQQQQQRLGGGGGGQTLGRPPLGGGAR
ncbi:hypothetical protein JCM8208_003961 [Rhodotorula glutinis]